MKKRVCVSGLIAVATIGLFFLLLESGCQKKSSALVLTVNPFPDNVQTVITCTETEAGVYYLFLPADTDRGALYVCYSGGKLRCEKTIVPNNTVTDFFVVGDEFLLDRGGESYTLRVKQSENIPAVFIQTEKELSFLHEDKTNKSQGAITITQSGSIALNEPLKHIKGRGNSSWQEPTEKKPYSIKLEKEVSLFGMESSAKYRLLTNYSDATLLKNTLAYEYGRSVGALVPDSQTVDLYINGDYRGNYLLTEHIEVGDGRVEIDDLDQANELANDSERSLFPFAEGEKNGIWSRWVDGYRSPMNITGGYLLEYDGNPLEEDVCAFSSSLGLSVELKSPEFSTEEEMDYISVFVRSAEEALAALDGYNSQRKHYSEYYDLSSLATDYIINEWFQNVDAGFSSTFLYKPKNEDQLFFGPIWDFDRSVAFLDAEIQAVYPGCEKQWIVNAHFENSETLFNLAFSHEDFRVLVGKKWKKLRSVFSDQVITKTVKEAYDRVYASSQMDLIRWKTWDVRNAFAERYRSDFTYLSGSLIARARLLDVGFSERNAMIYFRNDTTGQIMMSNIDFQTIGDTVVLPDAETVFGEKVYADGATFAGWRMAAPEGDRFYAPGDTVVLTGSEMNVYSVWR